jgi:hypothetical protein
MHLLDINVGTVGCHTLKSLFTTQPRLEGDSPPKLLALAVSQTATFQAPQQLKTSFGVEFSTCKINWILPP